VATDREVVGGSRNHPRGVAPDGFSRLTLAQQMPQSFQSGFVCGFEHASKSLFFAVFPTGK